MIDFVKTYVAPTLHIIGVSKVQHMSVSDTEMTPTDVHFFKLFPM